MTDADYEQIASANDLGKFKNMLRITEDNSGKHIKPIVDFTNLESMLNSNAMLKVGNEYVAFGADETASGTKKDVILKFQQSHSKTDAIAEKVNFNKIERSQPKQTSLKNAKVTMPYEGSVDKRKYRFIGDNYSVNNLFVGRACAHVIHEKNVSNGIWSWWAIRDAPYISMSNQTSTCSFWVDGVWSYTSINNSCSNCGSVEWNSLNYSPAIVSWRTFSASSNNQQAGGSNEPNNFNF